MKIAVSAVDTSEAAQIDLRFGRAPYFLVYDTETSEYDTLTNPGVESAHGAGIQAAQMMLNKKIDAVLSGRVGPNAYQILRSSGIDMRSCKPGSVKQAVTMHLKGELPEILQAGPAHGGQGKGRNR